MKAIISLGVGFLVVMMFQCNPPGSLVIEHQVSGPMETNCYLIYDCKSKEAALIDVGGPVDSLIKLIRNRNLKLKYIFTTHCHFDHIEGVPAVREIFPEVQLCLNRQDLQDFVDAPAWALEHFGPTAFEEMKKDPFIQRWCDFDTARLGGTNIFLLDNQVFHLGDQVIKTVLKPGHSRGSICYYSGNNLFTGDILFNGRVGLTTGIIGTSAEDLIQSVRTLYSEFPDETNVYPGHGQFTTIGNEKTGNSEISLDTVNLQD